ncbi:MAG: hypothetical protein KDD66_16625 [Bdellovibrionales bacterium]|nr:hypothetical protein [Bdellovibrionales bacterium]
MSHNQIALEEICEPLKSVLEQLLQNGADVASIDRNRWTQCILRICLDSGPSLKALRGQYEWNRGVASFKHSDPKYPAVVGLYCKQFQHGIDWPQEKVWQD